MTISTTLCITQLGGRTLLILSEESTEIKYLAWAYK